MIPFRVRPVRESDYPFVMKSWQNSLKRHSSAHAAMRWRAFKDDVLPSIRDAVDTDLVIVAADRDDDERLLGFIAVRPGARGSTLLYGYVRNGLRGMGIGSALKAEAEAMAPPIRYYITRTQEGVRWARRNGWEMLAARAA